MVLQPQVVEWYHLYLGHPGINRTEETIRQHFWWEDMHQCGYMRCMSEKQKETQKIWTNPSKNCGIQTLGKVVCGPNRTLFY